MRRSVVVLAIALAFAASSLSVGAAANAGNDPWQRAKAATARYHSFKQAQKAGYTVAGEPCVASPLGTMGIHAINPTLMSDSVIDPLRPEIILYVPDEKGKLRLIGLEYWKADADGNLATDFDRPSVLGQPFDGPMPGHNPTMPVHYDVHVWTVETNPSGFFAPFNPNLTCTP
jgi:hypothetical protein